MNKIPDKCIIFILMKQLHISFILLSLLQISCAIPGNKDGVDMYKNEILSIELAFAKMASEKGVPAAFQHFAAENAVLLRGENLIQGKAAIEANYEKDKALWENATLSWSPDFIDVSASGDMAYTYGRYTFSTSDSSGTNEISGGIFHTVWKRQEDGNWKFVWD